LKEVVGGGVERAFTYLILSKRNLLRIRYVKALSTPPPSPATPSNLNGVSNKQTYFFINIQCFNCVGPPSPPISLSLEDDISSLLSQSILSSSSSSSTSPPA